MATVHLLHKTLFPPHCNVPFPVLYSGHTEKASKNGNTPSSATVRVAFLSGKAPLSDENPDHYFLQKHLLSYVSGSEVSTLVAGAELLHKDGVKTRIVSVPSEGLFRSQSKEYQESILPAGAKVFGLTAGLPVNLLGLVGANGKIWGLESFGFSAPYKVLDEKLGFTAENVYNQVKEML